eukprot:SAG22_NODE_152_length_17377_cov_191.856928_18_plen_348_part_00
MPRAGPPPDAPLLSGAGGGSSGDGGISTIAAAAAAGRGGGGHGGGEPVESKRTLGTFSGVFLPCVNSIFGVVLFLRWGWAVGQVGVSGALLFLLLGTVISLITVSRKAPPSAVLPPLPFYLRQYLSVRFRCHRPPTFRRSPPTARSRAAAPTSCSPGRSAPSSAAPSARSSTLRRCAARAARTQRCRPQVTTDPRHQHHVDPYLLLACDGLSAVCLPYCWPASRFCLPMPARLSAVIPPGCLNLPKTAPSIAVCLSVCLSVCLRHCRPSRWRCTRSASLRRSSRCSARRFSPGCCPAPGCRRPAAAPTPARTRCGQERKTQKGSTGVGAKSSAGSGACCLCLLPSGC